MEITLKYLSRIQEIPSIRMDLENLRKKWTVPDSEMRQILVMIEEIFSNIVRHAYHDALQHSVEVQLTKTEDEIVIQIRDDGIPFNPLEDKPRQIRDPAASLDGGMGLTLIRTFSSSISYERVKNQNHLIISKKIKSNDQAG